MPKRGIVKLLFRVLGSLGDLLLYLFLLLPLFITVTLGSTCDSINEGGVYGCALGAFGESIMTTVNFYGVLLGFGGFIIVGPILLAAALLSIIDKVWRYHRGELRPVWLLLSAPALSLVCMIVSIGVEDVSDAAELLALTLTIAVVPWFLIEAFLYRKTRTINRYRAIAFAISLLFVVCWTLFS